MHTWPSRLAAPKGAKALGPMAAMRSGCSSSFACSVHHTHLRGMGKLVRAGVIGSGLGGE